MNIVFIFRLLWEYFQQFLFFFLRKRSSILLLSLTLVQTRIARLYGVTYHCRRERERESTNPFLQVIKTFVK